MQGRTPTLSLRIFTAAPEALTETQLLSACTVARKLGERWMEQELPRISLIQAPDVLPEAYHAALDEAAEPGQRPVRPAPGADPRLDSFREGVYNAWWRLASEVREKRAVLAELLGTPTEEIELAASIGGREVLLFGASKEFFAVFLTSEERRTAAARFLRHHLERFVDQPGLVRAHSILPEGADAVVEALQGVPSDVAHEAIEALLFDPDHFAQYLAPEYEDDPEVVTAGLFVDGAWYPASGQSCVLRGVEIDSRVLRGAQVVSDP